jgi:hypothetical protein
MPDKVSGEVRDNLALLEQQQCVLTFAMLTAAWARL